MKKGVILYHSNIKRIYKDRWIKKSIESMLNQTDSDLWFYEINYGSDNFSVLNSYNVRKKFWSIKMENYAQAMNFILDASFDDDCNLVFNTNLDDYYRNDRVELQTQAITTGGYDIVSSDFCYISEDEFENDNVTLIMNMKHYQLDIRQNLKIDHNVIAHPSVCYNKTFWSEKNNRYDVTKTPQEDLDLWKRAINNGFSFKMIPEILLYYRRHINQVSEKNGI